MAHLDAVRQVLQQLLETPEHVRGFTDEEVQVLWDQGLRDERALLLVPPDAFFQLPSTVTLGNKGILKKAVQDRQSEQAGGFPMSCMHAMHVLPRTTGTNAHHYWETCMGALIGLAQMACRYVCWPRCTPWRSHQRRCMPTRNADEHAGPYKGCMHQGVGCPAAIHLHISLTLQAGRVFKGLHVEYW